MASRSEVSNRHDVVVIGAGPAGEAAAELGGSLGYQVALVERDVVGGTGVLLGVHAICEIASEIAGTGQAMIHSEATVEDVIRMAYNTPTYTYGYKLAATDALARLHPDVLRAMRLPSQAHRI
jgi:pyruvate/2-oxoglutarate dehydrogenase complex dihydrolipoamide dehydrogenase (E3) component